jgi:pantetheine-phosphate adenylyltransferase
MVRAIFPGTFDPIHYGHMDIAERAAKLFDELIVAVYDRPLKNLLFSPEERLEMVTKVFTNHKKIRVAGYQGLTVEFRMALANHRLAPEIDVVALITSEEHSFLTGSTVREIASLDGDVSSLVPTLVNKALKRRFKELGEDGPKTFSLTSLRD